MVARRTAPSSGGDQGAAVRAAIRRRDWVILTDDPHAGRTLLWLATGMPAIAAEEFDLYGSRSPVHAALVVFPRHALARHNVDHFLARLGRPAAGGGWFVPVSDRVGRLVGLFAAAFLGCVGPGPVVAGGRG